MEPIAFGRYLLVEKLGQGGMAEIFRAVYRGAAGFEKEVALKRILPIFDAAPELRTMFVDEARIASTLTHVNIAQVFDFGEESGSYYLAMELVDGVDLGRLGKAAARRGQRVPPEVAAFIVAEAARGLAYAHEKCGKDGALLGIVHRDVSPQNVLVSYGGDVKLVDFGIAKATGKLHKTESGAVMGKIRYMSPEQVDGEPLDARSDLFALGVVFWELLVGAPLWPGDNPGALAEQVKRARVEPPSSRAANVPSELDAIVLGALERARDARYRRAGDLLRDLSAWLRQAAPSLSREDVGAFVAEVAPRPAGDAVERARPLAQAARSIAHAPTALSPSLPTPAAAPPTKRERKPRRARARAPLVLAGALLLAGGGLVAYRALRSVPVHDPVPGPLPVAVAVDAGTTISDAERRALLDALERLPRAEVALRGVVFEDYLALLSAVDAALCITPAGAQALTLPELARARVEAQQLSSETQALGRYLLATHELPPRVAGAFDAFLRSHPPFSTAAPAWNMARLAALAKPGDPARQLAVIRQNGALGAWRNGDGPLRALCERQPAVDAYAAAAPNEPRARRLRRYLAATPPELFASDGALRWSVVGQERDDAAATLLVRVRVTNPSGEERALPAAAVRLAGLSSAPTVDPPATRLGAGLVRELRLTFNGVTDELAEAAVLVIRDGVELQAYSEALR